MIKVQKLTSGPVIKGITDDDVCKFKVWGRGNSHKTKNCYLVLRFKEYQYDDYSSASWLDVNENTDYIDIIRVHYNNFKYYQMGFIHDHNVANIKLHLDWCDIQEYKHLQCNVYDPSTTEFIYGSCRRQVSVGPFTLFGSGYEADNIFKTISCHGMDFFMSVGDQVYFDYLDTFLRIKSLNGMRKLYRKVRNYPCIKNLMATVPTYEMCDDHDIHKNNTNHQMRLEEPQVFKNGLQSYYEYQHYDGPYDSSNNQNKKPNLWYSFSHNNTSFFVFDVRTERREEKGEIISDYQMIAFEEWLANNVGKVKFVVTPCPLVSQYNNDSWGAFPIQQQNIIETILEYENIYILTGDAHCARVASYDIYNISYEKITDDLDYRGTVTEIVSSGFLSIFHDAGKPFDKSVKDIELYNQDNDFPYEINNLDKNGLLIRTKKATQCYPYPNKPSGLQWLCWPFRRVVDNVFVKIKVENKTVDVTIYNQDGQILETISF